MNQPLANPALRPYILKFTISLVLTMVVFRLLGSLVTLPSFFYVLIPTLSAFVTGAIFVRQQSRDFTRAERWRMIWISAVIYCAGFLVIALAYLTWLDGFSGFKLSNLERGIDNLLLMAIGFAAMLLVSFIAQLFIGLYVGYGLALPLVLPKAKKYAP